MGTKVSKNKSAFIARTPLSAIIYFFKKYVNATIKSILYFLNQCNLSCQVVTTLWLLLIVFYVNESKGYANTPNPNLRI